MTLNELIEQAIKNRKGSYFISSAGSDMSCGKVIAFVDHQVGAAVRKGNAKRVSFTLNGKRIARDVLLMKLNANEKV